MYGLLRGTALPVNRRSRHHIGQASGEPAGARDIARQRPDGIDTAKHHIVVFVVGNAVAIHQGFEHVPTKVGAVHIRQTSFTPPRG